MELAVQDPHETLGFAELSAKLKQTQAAEVAAFEEWAKAQEALEALTEAHEKLSDDNEALQEALRLAHEEIRRAQEAAERAIALSKSLQEKLENIPRDAVRGVLESLSGFHAWAQNLIDENATSISEDGSSAPGGESALDLEELRLKCADLEEYYDSLQEASLQVVEVCEACDEKVRELEARIRIEKSAPEKKRLETELSELKAAFDEQDDARKKNALYSELLRKDLSVFRAYVQAAEVISRGQPELFYDKLERGCTEGAEEPKLDLRIDAVLLGQIAEARKLSVSIALVWTLFDLVPLNKARKKIYGLKRVLSAAHEAGLIELPVVERRKLETAYADFSKTEGVNGETSILRYANSMGQTPLYERTGESLPWDTNSLITAAMRSAFLIHFSGD